VSFFQINPLLSRKNHKIGLQSLLEEKGVVITVCVGSSCHVRGSHEILQRYSQIIAEHRLKDQVTLRGSFCMERCAEGVNMDIDGEPLSAQTLQEAERIFQEKVLARVSPRSHGAHGDEESKGIVERPVAPPS
jgi:hypothetical protein